MTHVSMHYLTRLLIAATLTLLPAAVQAQLLNYGDPVAGLNLLATNGEVYVQFTQAAVAPSGGVPDGYTLYAALTPGGTALAVDTVSSANTPFFHYLNVPAGTYWIRVIVGLNRPGPTTTADWRQLSVGTSGCSGTPAAPQNFRRVFKEGGDPLVELTWDRDPCYTFMRFEVGTAPGLSDLLVSDVPVATLRGIAPAGQYYTRIRGGTASGVSAPSNELPITVGGCVTSAPGNLAATVQGNTVSMTWTKPPVGTVQGYNFYVGSAPGAGVLLASTRFIGASTSGVPPGTYYVSLRAVFPCAPPEGPASNEIKVVVP